MLKTKQATIVILFLRLLAITVPVCSAASGQEMLQSKQAEREEMYKRYFDFSSYVKGGSIQPHWMADGSNFWYAEEAPTDTIIWKVDPVTNSKEPLFDTARLRQALTAVLGHEPAYEGLPFKEFTFLDENDKAIQFTVESQDFILHLDSYTITKAPDLSEREKNLLVPQVVRKWGMYGQPEMREVLSPDGRWFAHLKNYKLYLRSTVDGRIEALTTDGVKDYEWVGREVWETSWAWWSPDSFHLAVKKEDKRMMPERPIVHWLKPTEEVEWGHWGIAGGAIPQTELLS